ncbi:MAG: TIGR02302 family protein [Rhodobacteraceae bacterium]|nr:TIGR02302 family protein [Paracoccaceae bacterium]
MSDATTPPDRDDLPDLALRALRRPLRLTLAGLWAERLAQAFWPAVSALMASIAALVLGLREVLPGEAGDLTLGVMLAALLGLTGWGAVRFRRPRLSEALLRLDASLPGRPIAALTDAPAIGAGDAGSRAVWEAHLQRMALRAAAARAVPPEAGLARRDPFALRLVAATAFAVALLFGGSQGLGRLDLGLPGSGAQAEGPLFEAWIEPPAYTGRPSLYLNDLRDVASLRVPQGSRVTLRLYGQQGQVSVEQDVAEAAPGDGEDWSRRDFTVTRTGALRIVTPRGGEALWWIEMIPDLPPEILPSDELERLVSGRMRLPFAASDDYGVEAGAVRIALDLDRVDRRHGLAVEPEPRPGFEIDLPMPFRGSRTEFEDILSEDFAEHPWADLPVTLHFSVEDALGQTGTAEPITIDLPGRRFLDPLAAAIAEQRRDLLWTRENGARVARVLRMVMHRPDMVLDGPFPERPYLMLSVALRQLEREVASGLSGDARDEIAEALWQIALLIEEGDMADAAERLRRAQDRLSEALRQGASEAEIAELTNELREAMREYMREMARNAEPGDRDQAQGEMQEISPDQLQALLDRIEELAREGRTAEAEALLEQLRQLMENLQFAEGQGGEGGEGGEGGQNPGEQALEGLQDTLRGQRDLSDDSFRGLQQGQPGEGQPGQGQQGEGQQGQGTAPQFGQQQGDRGGARPRPFGAEPGEGGEDVSPEGLARRQEALRDLLERQRRALEGQSGPGTGEALERAERSMEAAREALRRGDLGRALDDQAEAMEALREGIREFAEDLARQQAPGQAGEERATGRTGEQSDPLGRATGRDGRLGRDGFVPDADSQQRARELQEEIRRRSGDRSRPEPELDYLRRLLERF